MMTAAELATFEREAGWRQEREAMVRLLRTLPVVALSVQQPWAWLIANGHKDVENRTWWSRQSGGVLIHAGKRLDKHGARWIRHTFPNIPLPPLEVLEVGGIVGRATVAPSVRPHASRWYAEGQWAHPMSEAEPLPFVPLRGMLGYFPVDDATREAVARALVAGGAR